jgi:hypothetical protein
MRSKVAELLASLSVGTGAAPKLLPLPVVAHLGRA